MNKESLILKLINMLINSDNSEPPEVMQDGISQRKPLVGDYCIVRCRDAGVHAGIVIDYNGREVRLKESRRLWYWKCLKGHSLSGLAEFGAHEDSKFTAVTEIIVTDACEIIKTSKEAEGSIRNAAIYNA